MSVLSDMFKGPTKPTRQTASPAEVELLAQAQRLRTDASQYLPLQNQAIAQASKGPGEDQQAGANTAGADTAQMLARTPVIPANSGDTGGINPLLKRAGALARVTQQSDGSVALANLRQRVAMTTYGRGIRDGAFKSAATAANVQAGDARLNYGGSLNPNYAAPYYTDALGTAIGAGLGYLTSPNKKP